VYCLTAGKQCSCLCVHGKQEQVHVVLEAAEGECACSRCKTSAQSQSQLQLQQPAQMLMKLLADSMHMQGAGRQALTCLFCCYLHQCLVAAAEPAMSTVPCC
jgi:hypothetical protein